MTARGNVVCAVPTCSTATAGRTAPASHGGEPLLPVTKTGSATARWRKACTGAWYWSGTSTNMASINGDNNDNDGPTRSTTTGRTALHGEREP